MHTFCNQKVSHWLCVVGHSRPSVTYIHTWHVYPCRLLYVLLQSDHDVEHVKVVECVMYTSLQHLWISILSASALQGMLAVIGH